VLFRSHCDGTGLSMSQESVALSVLRDLQIACADENVAKIDVAVCLEVAHHLSNAQRYLITSLENTTDKTITITAAPELSGSDVRITCTNSRGANVSWDSLKNKKSKTGKQQFVNVQSILDDKKSSRSRRTSDAKKRDTKDGQPEPITTTATIIEEAEQLQGQPDKTTADGTEEKPPKKSRRRGRRGGRNRRKPTSDVSDKTDSTVSPTETKDEQGSQKSGDKPKEETGRESNKPQKDSDTSTGSDKSPAESGNSDESAEPKKKRPRRRGRRGGRRKKTTTEESRDGSQENQSNRSESTSSSSSSENISSE